MIKFCYADWSLGIKLFKNVDENQFIMPRFFSFFHGWKMMSVKWFKSSICMLYIDSHLLLYRMIIFHNTKGFSSQAKAMLKLVIFSFQLRKTSTTSVILVYNLFTFIKKKNSMKHDTYTHQSNKALTKWCTIWTEKHII